MREIVKTLQRTKTDEEQQVLPDLLRYHRRKPLGLPIHDR
jgi:hypothetical protein